MNEIFLPSEDEVRKYVKETLEELDISAWKMGHDIVEPSDRHIRRWLHGDHSMAYHSVVKILKYLESAKNTTAIVKGGSL